MIFRRKRHDGKHSFSRSRGSSKNPAAAKREREASIHRVQFEPSSPVKGSRPGYYDGLLSYREKNGNVEFLITVFKVARQPLLTLGHEFAHLVDDLKSGNIEKHLGPPDDAREKKFDD